MSGKIGLALGGGGARGFAHLGVVRALRQLGVQIHCVSGTSIGAIIGGVVAAGMEDLVDNWLNVPDWKKLPSLFLEFGLPWRGLIRGRKIERFLRETIPSGCFSDLKMPFAVVATDYNDGSEVVLRDGDVHTAIRASMSIPGIFYPVEVNGHVLVDGGLVNPVPVDVCRSLGADRVIAVDINSNRTRFAQRKLSDVNIVDALDMMITICTNRMTELKMREFPPDLLLCPELRDINVLDFRNARELVAQGYEYAMSQRNEIKHIAFDNKR